MLMNFCVGDVASAVAWVKSLPASHSPLVLCVSCHSWKSLPKLKPAQNDRPAPRNTMTLTAGSCAAAFSAASISSGMAGMIVFNSAGRFRVIVAIASRVE